MRVIGKKPISELTKKEYDYLYKKHVLRCDSVFGKYIRARDKACIICGSQEKLECSHFYTKRSHEVVRWNEKNAHAMCSACHVRHHNIDQVTYTVWMQETYGEQFDYLVRLAHTIAKFTLDDLIEIELYYARKYEEML